MFRGVSFVPITLTVASTSVVYLEPVVSLVPVHNKAIIVATFRINFYLSSKGSYPQAKCKIDGHLGYYFDDRAAKASAGRR